MAVVISTTDAFVISFPYASRSLRRQSMFQPKSGSARSEILKYAVAALLTAFVSIELSPGTGAVGSAGSAAEVLIASASRVSANSDENHPSGETRERPSDDLTNTQTGDPHTATVGFEEKFHYRRPMYACLRFWYGNSFYDHQFQVLFCSFSLIVCRYFGLVIESFYRMMIDIVPSFSPSGVLLGQLLMYPNG